MIRRPPRSTRPETLLPYTTLFRSGVARDDSPVSLPHRTPRLPDQDRMWYSIGATWAARDNFDITASYSRVQMADTPVVGIASSSGSYPSGEYMVAPPTSASRPRHASDGLSSRSRQTLPPAGGFF